MILAIDQGTTGTTIHLTDTHGHQLASAYQEFSQIYPQPGWVEHDPLEIWQVTQQLITKTVNCAKIKLSDLRCIGITNQRETTLIWHKETGEPLYNAIVWQCRRSATICQKIKDSGKEAWLQQKTGLVVDAYFSATKLQWLFQQKPELKVLAQQGLLAFGTIDSWLIWRLSHGTAHLTDHTNASRTLLYNIHQQQWDNELLDFFDIPASVLPKIKSSAGLFCKTHRDSFFGCEIPITGVAGDQQAALFGQRCIEPGMVKNTYGTGCFMLMFTGEQAHLSEKGLLTTIACNAFGKPAYALEGSVFIAGAAIQWLRDQLQLINNAEESELLALSVEDSKGVYFVPALSGLGAPHWQMNATGEITGLTQGCNKAHIVRATLEAIAFQNYDVLTLMEEESQLKITQIKVDGGAAKNNFLMQFQADILQVPLIRPSHVEATAQGATMLAAIGQGLWQADNIPSALVDLGQTFTVKMTQDKGQISINNWHKAVDKCLFNTKQGI
jgi:glycerol kinase